MTTRRGFLKGMLALGVAPAIVRASSLMPVKASNWMDELVEAAVKEKLELINNALRVNQGHAKLLWPGVKEFWDVSYGFGLAQLKAEGKIIVVDYKDLYK